jgi:hypothetical protein
MDELSAIEQYLTNQILDISEIDLKTPYELFLLDYLNDELLKIQQRKLAIADSVKPWSKIINMQKPFDTHY